LNKKIFPAAARGGFWDVSMFAQPLETEWNRSGKKSPPESQTGGGTEKKIF
jgi:hypothetical protein